MPSYCTQCAAPIDSGVKFCGECGAPVVATPVAPSAPPVQRVSISHEDAKLLAKEQELAKGRSYLIGMAVIFVAIAAYVLWGTFS